MVIRKLERQNIAVFNLDLSGEGCFMNMCLSALQHDGRDIDGVDPHVELASNLNGRRTHPTTYIQHNVPILEIRPPDEFFR